MFKSEQTLPGNTCLYSINRRKLCFLFRTEYNLDVHACKSASVRSVNKKGTPLINMG